MASAGLRGRTTRADLATKGVLVVGKETDFCPKVVDLEFHDVHLRPHPTEHLVPQDLEADRRAGEGAEENPDEENEPGNEHHDQHPRRRRTRRPRVSVVRHDLASALMMTVPTARSSVMVKLNSDLQVVQLDDRTTNDRENLGGGSMTQVDRRTVKLGAVLGSLIERQGYSRNRQKILDSVGVSSSALSQYLRDQSRPSFEKLVSLATFFDVSLDYLVFGQREAPSVDAGPVPAMIEHALADARARTSRHAAIVRRITRVLADRVDDVARELAETPNASREGLLQDDELLRLERYARSVDVLSPDLDFDVVTLPDGTAAAGAFLEQVASNLARNCAYRFLASAEEGLDSGSTLREMLIARAGGDDVAALCNFRLTTVPVMVGVCLLEIDVVSFSAEEPALYEQLESYISSEGWIGYAIRPNRESNADMAMSKDRRERARVAFESAWRSAKGTI